MSTKIARINQIAKERKKSKLDNKIPKITWQNIYIYNDIRKNKDIWKNCNMMKRRKPVLWKAVCGKAARTDLWGLRGVTCASTRL